MQHTFSSKLPPLQTTVMDSLIHLRECFRLHQRIWHQIGVIHLELWCIKILRKYQQYFERRLLSKTRLFVEYLKLFNLTRKPKNLRSKLVRNSYSSEFNAYIIYLPSCCTSSSTYVRASLITTVKRESLVKENQFLAISAILWSNSTATTNIWNNTRRNLTYN